MKFLVLALVIYTVQGNPLGYGQGQVYYATTTSFKEADCYSGLEFANTCKGSYPAYVFDVSTKSCRQTTYGGCAGSNSFFKTREECDYVARTVCRPAVTKVIVPSVHEIVSPVREIVRGVQPLGYGYGYGYGYGNNYGRRSVGSGYVV